LKLWDTDSDLIQLHGPDKSPPCNLLKALMPSCYTAFASWITCVPTSQHRCSSYRLWHHGVVRRRHAIEAGQKGYYRLRVWLPVRQRSHAISARRRNRRGCITHVNKTTSGLAPSPMTTAALATPAAAASAGATTTTSATVSSWPGARVIGKPLASRLQSAGQRASSFQKRWPAY